MKKLAIFGGIPISSKKLQKQSTIGKDELTASIEVIKRGILSRAGRGEYVKAFEQKFASFHRVKHAVSTTSGTTALHAAVSALGITKGDEVLVPSLTFISSASVILQQGAIPVFVDADPKTFCLEVKDLEKKITRKTKAIIVVHLYGCPVDMDDIMQIARKHSLKVIEDCAQAHGAKYRDKLVGTFGDAGCFSFYQTKNITTGEGGIVITNNNNLYNNCASIVDHGLKGGKLEAYNYDRLGYNYHLTELQAAIGLVQLRKLNYFNKLRRKNAYLYKEILANSCLTFQEEPQNAYSVYYCLSALLPNKFVKYRDWFIEAVRAENVEVNRLYPLPLHQTDLFKQFNSKCLNAENIASRLFNFYTNPSISEKYIRLTCKAVQKVLNYLEDEYG